MKSLNLIPQSLWVLILALFQMLISSASADEISLNIYVQAVDDEITYSVTNVGRDPARQLKFKLELDGHVYRKDLANRLAPGAKVETKIQVKYPSIPGTHPLITEVSYLNLDSRLSIVNVGEFNYQKRDILEVDGKLARL